jgi:hypothetical protein
MLVYSDLLNVGLVSTIASASDPGGENTVDRVSRHYTILKISHKTRFCMVTPLMLLMSRGVLVNVPVLFCKIVQY